MIFPQRFEEKLGFDRLRMQLKAACLCSLGIERVDQMHFLTDEKLIKTQLGRIAEFIRMQSMEQEFPIQYFFDLVPVLKRLRVEGTFPETEEVFNLQRSLVSIRSMVNFLVDKGDKYPLLLELTEGVKVFPIVLDSIGRILNNQGRIKDNASPALLNIRKEIQQKTIEVSRKVQQAMRFAQVEGWAEEGATPVICEGRLTIPLLANYKRRLKGFIQGESATGKTSFVEPSEAVELNNDIRELEYEEKYEIVKILTAFADFIRPYIDDILPSYDFLGEIDFIRAKSRLAMEINANMPIINQEQGILWNSAVHPLLYLHHKKEGREVVPLDIALNKNERILVISGPNAGGKSVCLQTVGLIQYMLQCGLLVPMRENSECGIFKKLFIDIGDEQSIDNDLSTYSSHLQNMKFFLRNADDFTLFLIDEFGTGTEPNIGGAIAESIMEELNRKGAFGVITTHYTNLKHFASNHEGVINGAMLFDTHNLAPVFKLAIGEPGSSFAFEIARKIGLQESILQSATQKVGENQIDYDKHLKDIIRDKHYWERKRNQIKENDKKLETIIAQYSVELEKINLERKEIIRQAKSEAQQLLAGVNKQIENTIKSIREAQAEKEKTREARHQIEIVRKEVETFDEKEEAAIQIKIQKLKKREEEKSDKINKPKVEVKVENKIDNTDLTIRIGDKVKLFGTDNAGEVLDINGKSVMVGFGNMVTTLSENRLEKISNNEFKKITRHLPKQPKESVSLSEKKLNFKTQLDLRGMRGEEAMQKFAEYIDGAIMVGISEVRILHGKGNGILRQLIRDYLRTSEISSWYGDEQVELGGAGITVVKF